MIEIVLIKRGKLDQRFEYFEKIRLQWLDKLKNNNQKIKKNRRKAI